MVSVGVNSTLWRYIPFRLSYSISGFEAQGLLLQDATTYLDNTCVCVNEESTSPTGDMSVILFDPLLIWLEPTHLHSW